MQNNITLSAEAVRVITALQHKNGTYTYYRANIDRIYTYILHTGDEIGMSDTEILHTIRALDAIRSDLKDLAGVSNSETEDADTSERFVLPVDVVTMEHVDFSDPVEGDPDYTQDAIRKLTEARYAVLKAGRMTSDLNVDLFWKLARAIEKAVMEICRYHERQGERVEANTDEPQEPAYAELAATFLNRAAEAINYGEKLFIDAVDCAKRAGAGDAFKKEALEIDRSLTNSIEMIKKLTDYAPLLENHDNEPRTADTDD